jgi:peroxiredoxin
LKALPETLEALKGLPSDQVLLIGVNQGEPAPQVRTFLTTRRWNLATVLDVDQAVGKQFGVESIPHTVVIGPDGKVALVKTGYSETAAGEIAAKVRELLKAE